MEKKSTPKKKTPQPKKNQSTKSTKKIKETFDKIDELEFDLDEMKKDIQIIELENDYQKDFLIKTIKENETELLGEVEKNKTNREKNRNSWFNRVIKTLFG